MMTVNRVKELTGISVRALHHYDAIGLLKPSGYSPSGYRLYDDAALEKLQAILLLRELEFPLKEIKAILDSPGFDIRNALKDQLRLLGLKRERVDRLIAHTKSLLEKGDVMDFSAFDDSKEREYAEEAKKRWGDTAAWREYEAKKPGADASKGLMEIFARFGSLKGLKVEDAAVQKEVRLLQSFITQNYYECTDAILGGLGKMYSADPRFKANIDKAGGEGTAGFVSKAIAHYCENLER